MRLSGARIHSPMATKRTMSGREAGPGGIVEDEDKGKKKAYYSRTLATVVGARGSRAKKLLSLATLMFGCMVVILLLQSLRRLAEGHSELRIAAARARGESAIYPSKLVFSHWTWGGDKDSAESWASKDDEDKVRSLVSPWGDKYEILAKGSASSPSLLFPGLDVEKREVPGYDVVILTTVKKRQNGPLLLCNTLWSVIAKAKAERVSVVWSEAATSEDLEVIREFTVQCSAGSASNVVHLMEPELDHGWANKYSKTGPPYAKALKTQLGRNIHTVILEGDVELLPGFHDRVQHWIECMGTGRVVKLYQASDFEPTSKTLDQLVPKKDQEVYMAIEEGKRAGYAQSALRSTMPLLGKKYKVRASRDSQVSEREREREIEID